VLPQKHIAAGLKGRAADILRMRHAHRAAAQHMISLDRAETHESFRFGLVGGNKIPDMPVIPMVTLTNRRSGSRFSPPISAKILARYQAVLDQ
jgi:hypothetical protein